MCELGPYSCLLGAEPAGQKSAIVWSPSVFSRRFRGSCRNPDEVHGTLTARRQFPIHFSVGTDPDKKVTTLPRDRPTGKDKGQSTEPGCLRIECGVSDLWCCAARRDVATRPTRAREQAARRSSRAAQLQQHAQASGQALATLH